MNDSTVDSGTIAELLRKYLPELPPGEVRADLHARLVGEAIAASEVGAAEPDTPPPPAYDAALDADGKFLDYVTHYVNAWGRQTLAAATGAPVVAPENSIHHDFIASQVGAVSGLMTRTLLEELYRRRARGMLQGDTPHERYRSFRGWTNSHEGHAELLAQYPLLFRSVRARVKAAAQSVEHILTEVDRHRERLAEQIPGLAAGSGIVSVALGQGDTHNGGRSVARIRFADGGQVLYKPHPMEAEAGYQCFVGWMNRQLGLALPTLSVVPTDGAGFVEYAPTGEPSGGGVEGYFVQIGQLAGILYLLRATDIHYANVVTSSRGPVVVDAETLLTPRLRVTDSDDANSAARRAAQMIRESVVGIGVLPMVMRARMADRGLDVGVIGYDPGQRHPFKMLAVRNPGRDDMFAELVEVQADSPSANMSVLRAVEVPVRRQRDLIKREFRRVLEHARAHPGDVCDAIERYLGDAAFRYVNHATVFYSQLLRMATHPDAVRDPAVRAAVLSRVSLLTGDAYEIAREEMRQLAAGDVPYFSHSARSRALFARGAMVCDDVFEEPALAAIRTRISGLDAETIDWELRLVDISFLSKLPPEDGRTEFSAVRAGGAPPAGLDRTRVVKEAVRIGDGLVATMVDGSDRQWPATWIAPQIMVSAEESQWTPGVLGFDIYGGAPGIALALAGLARETGDRRYGDAARRVVEPFEEQLRSGALRRLKISAGGMNGLAGTIYAIATANRLLGAPDGTSAAELGSELAWMVTRADGPHAGTAEPDFVSGLAGTLAVCLSLYRHAVGQADRTALATAVRTVAAAELQAIGGAALADGRITPHTGYAHGAMGIGPVLVEYGAAFDDPDAYGVGLRIIDAVLGAYDARDGDWPVEWEADEPRSYGWCHGAPGILLGCLTAERHAPSSVPTGTLARLAELTLHRGFGHNPSYCHGDLGCADIVALADRELPGLFDRETVEQLYPRLFAEVVETYEECVDSRFAYSNSLMVGQAGFAWSILRYLDPNTYPSILRLD